MANKSKIINAAQKYISKGQWDRAIKELHKLVAEDPSDVRTLLKLGDVYSKKGDRQEASRVYKQVAESYSEQGFFLKAVAVYKQILKHDPKHLDVTLKLAELYEHLGLQSEAMQQYQAAAAIHDEAGETKQSLEVLERMVELDTENVASRIKLAESYSREGMVNEAVDQFERATDVLKGQARIDDYIKVAERLVYHAPDRLATVMELAKLYLSRGDTKRALAKLQICFKANPRDIQTLRLLAQAFNDLGQTQKTVFVYRELARIYEEAGQPDEARSVLQMILEVDPNDPEAQEALGLRPSGPSSSASAEPKFEAPIFTGEHEMPVLDPEPVYDAGLEEPVAAVPVEVPVPSLAPRPAPDAAIPSDDEVLILDAPEDVVAAETVPPRPPPPHPSDREQIAKILTETDVYIKYGLREKALDHLRSVFDLDPDNVGAYYKMRDIYASMGDNARAAEALANLLHVHARRGDVDALNATREELRSLAPGHPLVAGGLPGAIPPPIEDDDDQLSIDITEDSSDFLVDFSDEASDLGLDAAFEAPVEAPMEAPVELDPFDGSPQFASFDNGTSTSDLDETNESPAYSGPLSYGAVPSDVDELPVVTGSQVMMLDGDGATDAPSARPVRRAPLPPTHDLIDVDDHPGFDDAIDHSDPAYDMSEDQTVARIPTDEEVAAARDLSGPVAIPDSLLDDSQEPATDTSLLPSDDLPDDEIDDEIDEAEFLLEANLVDEAREALTSILGRAPKNGRALDLLRTLDGGDPEDVVDDTDETQDGDRPQPGSNDLAFDAGTGDLDNLEVFSLDDTDDDLPLDEPPADTPPEPMSTSPIILTGGDDPTAEDRYDQGMACRELGRYDDAIREFEAALGSDARRVTAYEMIGHCYLDKGQPDEAISYFSQAMEAGADGFALINLKYEVGAAYAACGDMDAAVQWFYACARDDPQHRGVMERLRDLGVNLAGDDEVPSNGATVPEDADPEPDPPAPQPTKKKSKISYL